MVSWEEPSPPIGRAVPAMRQVEMLECVDWRAAGGAAGMAAAARCLSCQCRPLYSCQCHSQCPGPTPSPSPRALRGPWCFPLSLAVSAALALRFPPVPAVAARSNSPCLAQWARAGRKALFLRRLSLQGRVALSRGSRKTKPRFSSLLWHTGCWRYKMWQNKFAYSALPLSVQEVFLGLRLKATVWVTVGGGYAR